MPPEAAPLLKAAGVDAGYGTMQVLWGVDLDVRPARPCCCSAPTAPARRRFSNRWSA